MFGSAKNDKASLEKQYKALSEEAFQLSHSNRRKSDEKRAEAEEIGRLLDELEKSERKA